MTTPQHCPGYEQFKHLKSFSCKCPSCGEEKEIFSDELEKKHT
jgi:rubredoxin